MTPAEKRIKELIDRWLTSIELHLQYSSLSDEVYWRLQAWPKHDRPTRWVLESAKQKASELKDVFESRHAMGDSKFAEALELMNFLANLVGAQHVDRFIPLAEPNEETAMPTAPVRTGPPPAPPTSDVPSWYIQAAQKSEAPARPAPARTAPAQSTPAPAVQSEPPRRPENDPDATREMPKFRAQPQSVRPSAPARPAPAPTKIEARKTPAPAPQKAEARKAAPAKQTAAKNVAAPNEIQQTVMNDAIRLLSWGRTWHELADLIARMADRPPIAEIRKILRTYRPAIEKAAKEQAKG